MFKRWLMSCALFAFPAPWSVEELDGCLISSQDAWQTMRLEGDRKCLRGDLSG
jgi:hypothetical protein